MKKIALILFCSFNVGVSAQNFPWQNALKMATSTDGITFTTSGIFQDSSGVPSVIRWKGDTLICAFQWFRAPTGSGTWDKVAVKFSYNNGISWTQPTPIVVNGLPANYQRPFDPTLLKINNDSLRIYFSSSDGTPFMGLDSTVNTYSAKSNDGITYTFENNARVDEISNRVIDPAVVHFNNAFHYISPIGSPQEGAYHYVSPDGLNFTKVPDIPSDNNHNWTGNYLPEDSTTLRFYGAGGQGIWFNSSSNGGVWNGYTPTNIQGGDPTVIKLTAGNYLLIYVGMPNSTGFADDGKEKNLIAIYPNPAQNFIQLVAQNQAIGSCYSIYDMAGKLHCTGKITSLQQKIAIEYLASGLYILKTDLHQPIKFNILK